MLEGTRGDGDGRAVAQVAGVVLCAPTDSNVRQGESGVRNGQKRLGSCGGSA